MYIGVMDVSTLHYHIFFKLSAAQNYLIFKEVKYLDLYESGTIHTASILFFFWLAKVV